MNLFELEAFQEGKKIGAREGIWGFIWTKFHGEGVRVLGRGAIGRTGEALWSPRTSARGRGRT
jgi:hypothetical protein